MEMFLQNKTEFKIKIIKNDSLWNIKGEYEGKKYSVSINNLNWNIINLKGNIPMPFLSLLIREVEKERERVYKDHE